jgi:asparagine synthase (glutamine-hydrolysing)
MCGVAGFIDRKLQGSDAETALRRMAVSIKHRGPDGEGYYHDEDNGVALAHRRLAIIDVTSAGAQPMDSMCDRYVFSFNGEIYNFQEIRGKIEAARGRVSWKGHSDTEVLLEAIAQFGLDDALEMATGMFAFALWDKSERALYLARDRFGEKPLYYLNDGNWLAFSSELESVTKFPRFRAEIDESAVGAYLQFGYVPGESTLLRHVRKVLPGHYVRFSTSGGPALEFHCYWDPRQELFDQPKRNSSIHDAVDQLEGVLTKAIESQLVADVGLGSFLSAGVDSSLISSIIRRRLDRPLLTFSMGFEDERYDESSAARVIAAHLGTDHHEHIVRKSDVLAIVQSVPEIFDEPIGDTSVLPTYLVCKMARTHVTVALSGDGGDEIFGGYKHYRWGTQVVRNVRRIPKSVRTQVGPLVSKVGYAAGRRSIVKLGHLIKEAASSDPKVLLNGALIDAEDGVPAIKRKKFLESATSALQNLSLEHQLMAVDLYGFLPSDILCKVDRAAMGVSLETRAPFLDRRVAQFGWTLMPQLTASGPSSKYILRELLARYLPKDITDRPKQGFGIPLDGWFREELKSFVEKNLNILKSKYGHLVLPAFVDKYWSEHLSGKINWQREIWTLVVLVMFLETYF